MIIEGIVTTVNRDGVLKISPMGPRVNGSMGRFLLRPFRSSTTYRNLKARGEGVFHVTDDVLLMAKTAIGEPVVAQTRPASAIEGQILVAACRYYEFRLLSLDDSDERTTMEAETVAEGRIRDFIGFNRAKNAVVEAAILVTRLSFLPLESIFADFQRLAPLVEKTGGPAEFEAFALLSKHLEKAMRKRGFLPGQLRL